MLNSDAAGQVLQGWEMLHGNPLLRGWFLSDVSFYTFEVPLDGLVAIAFGPGPNDLHVAAALVYTLLVLVAALLAKGKARAGKASYARCSRPASWSRPCCPGAHVLLLAPDHTGIGVPVMLTLLLMDFRECQPRAPRSPGNRALGGWWVPVVACVLLTWAQIDDPVATFACAAATGNRVRRAGGCRSGWRRRQRTHGSFRGTTRRWWSRRRPLTG